MGTQGALSEEAIKNIAAVVYAAGMYTLFPQVAPGFLNGMQEVIR